MNALSREWKTTDEIAKARGLHHGRAHKLLSTLRVRKLVEQAVCGDTGDHVWRLTEAAVRQLADEGEGR